jgi:hypothetical protein
MSETENATRRTSARRLTTTGVLAIGIACTKSPPPGDARTADTSARAVVPARVGPQRHALQATSSYRAWYDSADRCSEHRIVNQRYSRHDGFVLLETTDNTQCATAEGSRDATVRLQRWQNDSIGGAPRYTAVATGDVGRVVGPAYEVETFISGGGDHTFEYFSLDSGSRVFRSATPALRVSWDGAVRRFVGLEPDALHFGDGTRRSAQIRIGGMTGIADDYCVARFGFVQSGLSTLVDSLVVGPAATEGTPPAEFVVRAELTGCPGSESTVDYWLEVPFVDDRPVLDRARTSPGLRLTLKVR